MGAKSGRFWLYCFCYYSVFSKLVEPEPCLLCQWMCWRPKMLKQLCLLVMGAVWVCCREMCCTGKPTDLPSWSVWNILWTVRESLFHCSVLLICLVLHGVSALWVFCFIACLQKRLRWKEQSKPSYVLDFPQGVWNCLGECLYLSASKGVKLSQRR